jgi:serine/threonine-protein kinase
LNRFVAVCNAIEYAHSRGVLHRDLKPANIMLGKFGETLVVDWGLAKVIGRMSIAGEGDEITLHRSAVQDSNLTQLGSAVGTPAYMSPEQASGRLELLKPASDVYSLGATLYTLLCGKPAFAGTEYPELLRQVARGQFISPRGIQPNTPRRLSAICMKAMALDPAHRYSSARALADDIEHYLADEPVVAYPENALEKTARWMRRHRSWVQAAAVALAAMTAISIAAAVIVNAARRNEERQRRVAEAQRQSAQIARQEAVEGFRQAREKVDKWLTGASDVLKYYPGMQGIRQGMLEQAAADYERFALHPSADAAIELERGRTQIRLGDVQSMLGDLDASQQAYRRGMTIFDELISKSEQWADVRVDRANAHVKLALARIQTGNLPDADRDYEAAIRELNALATAPSAEPRVHVALGNALFNYAVLQRMTGEQLLAISTLAKSLQSFGQVPEKPDDVQYAEAAAQSLWGQCLIDTGSYYDGVPHFEKALASFADLIARFPDKIEYLEFRAAATLGLAAGFRQLGKYDDERKCYDSAAADYQALDQALPDAPIWRENLALTNTDQAQLLQHQGQTHLAKSKIESALVVFSELRASHNDVARYHEEEAAAQDILGRILSDLGSDELARDAHETAIKTYDSLQQKSPDVASYRVRHAISQSHLGQVLHKLAAFDEAERQFTTAMASLDALSDDMPEAVDAGCYARNHLGALLMEMGKSEQAKEAFVQAHARWAELVAKYPAAEFADHLALALVLCPNPQLRDANQAVSIARRACEQVPDNMFYLGTLAGAKYRQGEFRAAIADLEVIKQARPAYHGRECFFLAMALARDGQADRAKQALEEGRQWQARHMPGNLELKRLAEEAAQVTIGADSASPQP